VPEAHHHVLRVQRLDLEQDPVVEHSLHHAAHVVRLVVRVRHQRIEVAIGVGDLEHRLAVVPQRRVGQVVRGKVAEERLDVVDGVLLVRAEVVGDAGLGVVRDASAEFFEADVLARDRLDHVRAGDEHVGGLVHHHDEVRERGGVDGAAGGRAEDQRDLGDDAGRRDVAPEDLRELREGGHALLDPRAAAVGDADQRHTRAQGEVHDFGDLLSVHLAERAAEHREVLGEDADLAPADRAVAGDDAVSRRAALVQAEVRGPVLCERVELHERALVEEHLDPLARGLLAALALLLDRAGLGFVDRFAAPSREVVELRGRGLGAGQGGRIGHGFESSCGVRPTWS